MKYLLAIDSFKGCLTSSEAEKAAAEGILNVDENAEIISVPVSDGGEGMIEAFSNSLKGELITAKIHDPLMRLISSEYFISTEGIAIIEIAKACGITLLSDNERNPLITTSYGVGELILDALSRGCKNFIIGLGGSATSDCGIGMLRALINSLAKDKHFDDINLDVNITLASDVTNPLYGKYGAAHVFGRQKGATAEMIEWLDLKAKKFAEVSARHFGYDCSNLPGAGAAGGLGYAFLQYFGAKSRPGVDLLFDIINFNNKLEDVDYVITGEGRADDQTIMGKLPYGVLKRAKIKNKKVYLIAGKIEDKVLLVEAGFDEVICINNNDMDLAQAINPENAKANIKATMINLYKNK